MYFELNGQTVFDSKKKTYSFDLVSATTTLYFLFCVRRQAIPYLLSLRSPHFRRPSMRLTHELLCSCDVRS